MPLDPEKKLNLLGISTEGNDYSPLPHLLFPEYFPSHKIFAEEGDKGTIGDQGGGGRVGVGNGEETETSNLNFMLSVGLKYRRRSKCR